MAVFGYTLQEYEDVIKKLEKVTGEVTKHWKTKNDPLTPELLEKKLGSKHEMAGLILKLTKACSDSKNILQKVHSQNFDLRGKVAVLSINALNRVTSDIKIFY